MPPAMEKPCLLPWIRANLKMQSQYIFIMKPQANLSVEHVLKALSSVIDPEVGANIVDLGLIYCVDLEPAALRLDMTMTSSACPMGDMIMDEAYEVLRALLPADTALDIRLVWEPAWTPERMSDSLKQQFGWTRGA